MEPLICPQCGGQITNYLPGATFATCGYCSTKFLIDQNKQSDVAPDFSPPVVTVPPRVIAGIVAFVLVVGVFLLFVAMQAKQSPPKGRTPTAPSPRPGASASPELPANLLEFGGKGTGNGLFKDANSIAVDSKGQIYVSDDSLRIQQFDDKGAFIKSFIVPAKTGNYDHARTIDKIAVGDDGRLYVAVGGVIRVYNADSSEFIRVMEMAPDYISDFALKSDGGMDMVYENDRIETLIVVTKTGKITKRIDGFHTKALDAAISPQETAIASIRIAVDGAGRIFSVYALGDLGSYSISSNNDELLIAHFNADGKFLNKFVQSMTSCGIAVDNQGRVYVSDSSNINAYNDRGEPTGSVTNVGHATAFALDKDNNVYVLADDKVIKRPPVL